MWSSFGSVLLPLWPGGAALFLVAWQCERPATLLDPNIKIKVEAISKREREKRARGSQRPMEDPGEALWTTVFGPCNSMCAETHAGPGDLGTGDGVRDWACERQIRITENSGVSRSKAKGKEWDTLAGSEGWVSLFASHRDRKRRSEKERDTL